MVARVIMLSACILCCWSDHCPLSPSSSAHPITFPFLFLTLSIPSSTATLTPFFSPVAVCRRPATPCHMASHSLWSYNHREQCSHHSIVLPSPYRQTTLISTPPERVMFAEAPHLSFSLHHATEINISTHNLVILSRLPHVLRNQ